MTALALATWNINSVRLRVDQAVRFARENDLDVLCLQETKCREDQFPAAPFEEAGYTHIAARGQKGGMHGVAVVSRRPFERLAEPAHCREDQARCLAVKVDGLVLHNYYAPSGGDEPDEAVNPKFAHKMDFWRRVRAWAETDRAQLNAEPTLIVGDLNIAPGQYDVTEHRANLKNVGHTPMETEAMTTAREAGGFVDLARALTPEPALINTWWSYRVKEWSPTSRGWRLDYLWPSAALADRALAADGGVRVHHETRSWTKPSDHVPVTVRLP